MLFYSLHDGNSSKIAMIKKAIYIYNYKETEYELSDFQGYSFALTFLRLFKKKYHSDFLLILSSYSFSSKQDHKEKGNRIQ
jgi:hypothetical protein